MKYEITQQGDRLEAIGAHSGYRIRISTVLSTTVAVWPVSVHVRGSESEAEVQVDLPKRHLSNATEAFDYGYECAAQWIDAQDHRL